MIIGIDSAKSAQRKEGYSQVIDVKRKDKEISTKSISIEARSAHDFIYSRVSDSLAGRFSCF